MRTATVAQALLRAVAGQLIQASRGAADRAAIIRATTPALGGLHAPPTCADLARYAPASSRASGSARGAPALVRVCRTLELERLKAQPSTAVARGSPRARARPVVGRRRLPRRLGRYEYGLVRVTSGSRSSRPRCGAGGSRPRRATRCSRRTASGPASRACTSCGVPRGFVPLPDACRLTCTSSTTPLLGRRAARRAGASPAARSSSPAAPHRGPPTARSRARARLEQGHALVGRRPVRPARATSGRTTGLRRRHCSTSWRAARREVHRIRGERRRRGGGRARRRARGRRSSTCCCSASARTRTSRRSSPARRSSTSTDHAPRRPRRARAVGRPRDDDDAEIRAAKRIVFIVERAAKAEAVARASAAISRPCRPCEPVSLAPIPSRSSSTAPQEINGRAMSAPEPQYDPTEVLELERPEQLKALGHPLRLKVLQAARAVGEAADEPRARGQAVRRPRPPPLPRADAAPRGSDRARGSRGPREAVPRGREAPRGRQRGPRVGRRQRAAGGAAPRAASAASSSRRGGSSSGARRCTRSSTPRPCASCSDVSCRSSPSSKTSQAAATITFAFHPPITQGETGLGQDVWRFAASACSMPRRRASSCSTSAVSATAMSSR